ncbi:P2Y purinoceptor 14 [Larimichthys crocea]|uniref:P2Y purinoceptor 14 n=1 Tax=Larimichthys crocea TaxID=215358 RepID=UPI000F5DE177|nr:P2Y purinoceptor 14 [Larimichthys crocea]XP_027135720.1 P2Y purinoceptor 14 [Larimichthys crocea]
MGDLRGVGVTPSFNQSSVSNNSTPCEQVDTSGHVFFMVIYSLMFVVGLILNGFTLKVYFCRPQQLTTSSMTIYLKNLAAADFLISLCLPIRIMYYASSSIYIHQVYCSFGAATFFMNMYASIMFMGYIAANRYLKIVYPSRTHILGKVRPAHIISTVTWVFLLTMTGAYIILLFLMQNKATTSVPDTRTCEDLYSGQFSLFHKMAQFCCVVIFLFVLVSLVFFYYSTSRRLSLAQQRQPASSSNKKLAKSRRNMLVLVSVFCVCFVPYHLARLPYVFLWSQYSLSQVLFYLKELTIIVSALNVCLDPLIYFIFSKAFRAQLGLTKLFRTTQVPMNEGNHEGEQQRQADECRHNQQEDIEAESSSVASG